MIPLRDYRPSHVTPYVSYALLALNVGAFLYQLLLQGQVSDVRAGTGFISEGQVLVFKYGVVPCKLFGDCPANTTLDAALPAWMTLFTSMFMHGGLMHLGGNMLYLWIFGDNVEAAFGHVKFLAFYLLCGLAAALAQALPDLNSATPMIGASGAISGVLGAYLFLFPHARVLTLVPIFFFVQFIELPALIVLGLWFGLQLFSALSGAGGGVAFMAHVGGFVAGAALYRLFLRRRREPPPAFWQ